MRRVESVGDLICLEIARATVAEIAADELELFDQIASSGPVAPLIKDEALAFGIGDALQLLTPAVLDAARNAVAFVAPKLFDATLDIAKDTLKDKIRASMAKRPGSSSGGDVSGIKISFSKEQLQTVRDNALKQFTALGLKGISARQAADALVGKLSLL